MLKKQNELVGNHPNCHMYNQLQGLVDFDGFYLESEPCLVCNDPEVPFSVSCVLRLVLDYIHILNTRATLQRLGRRWEGGGGC